MAVVTPNDPVAQLLKEYDYLKNGRSNWENYWQQIADLMVPRRSDFTVRHTAGQERRNKIFDYMSCIDKVCIRITQHSDSKCCPLVCTKTGIQTLGKQQVRAVMAGRSAKTGARGIRKTWIKLSSCSLRIFYRFGSLWYGSDVCGRYTRTRTIFQAFPIV